jgi:hypothetical protein
MQNEPRFSIGTKFTSGGKHPRICTIVDIHKTYNSAGDLVWIEYVATHEFMGQTVTDYHVCDTTVARNILKN